jgi:hypothetical protein
MGSILPAVEASGDAILSIVAGLGVFRPSAERFLREAGLDQVVAGAWYPAEAWLRAFGAIAEKVGDRALYYVGDRIPETALLPPDIVDVPSALLAIDVGYHMNHRLHGRPMFDPATGQMSEGIGHYALQTVDGQGARVVCDGPYPCDFDSGIVHGFAARFAADRRLVRVTHGPGGCRKQGAEACVYRVQWG